MWAESPGELVKLSGRFTGNDYVEVLEDVFLLTVRALAIPDPLTIVLVPHSYELSGETWVTATLENRGYILANKGVRP